MSDFSNDDLAILPPLFLPPDISDDDIFSSDSSIRFFIDLIEEVRKEEIKKAEEEDTATSKSTKRIILRDRVKAEEEDTATSKSTKRIIPRDREKGLCGKSSMEVQMPAVKATLRLGSETHSIEASKGILSEQLAFVKGESMNILKEFITTHNVPNDVPDEVSSDDDDGDDEAPAVKSKKVKT